MAFGSDDGTPPFIPAETDGGSLAKGLPSERVPLFLAYSTFETLPTYVLFLPICICENCCEALLAISEKAKSQ